MSEPEKCPGCGPLEDGETIAWMCPVCPLLSHPLKSDRERDEHLRDQHNTTYSEIKEKALEHLNEMLTEGITLRYADGTVETLHHGDVTIQ